MASDPRDLELVDAAMASIARLREVTCKAAAFAEAIGEAFPCDREGSGDHLGEDDDPSDCWHCSSLLVKRLADEALVTTAT